MMTVTPNLPQDVSQDEQIVDTASKSNDPFLCKLTKTFVKDKWPKLSNVIQDCGSIADWKKRWNYDGDENETNIQRRAKDKFESILPILLVMTGGDAVEAQLILSYAHRSVEGKDRLSGPPSAVIGSTSQERAVNRTDTMLI